MTHPKLKKLSQLLFVALGAGTTATLLVSPAFAQQAAPQKIEKIEVTGSNIKRIDAEMTGLAMFDPASLAEAKGLLA